MTESAIHYSRLYWQCRRGMRELDDLFMGFMAKRYHLLDDEERAAFENLLTYPDQLLAEYLLGRLQPADSSLHHVIAEIRAATAD